MSPSRVQRASVWSFGYRAEKFDGAVVVEKADFTGFQQPVCVAPSGFVRPSVNIGPRAKRNWQRGERERESCIPIGEARRCLRPRVRDHLAAGVEKETREVTLRNGVRLPTALELIAKINIHYCNYFLRRGRAEGATITGVRERMMETEIERKSERMREGRAGGEEKERLTERG